MQSFLNMLLIQYALLNFLLLILIKFSVLTLENKLKEVFQAKVNYMYSKQRLCSKLSLGC